MICLMHESISASYITYEMIMLDQLIVIMCVQKRIITNR
jgi:hypothetical protein